MDIEKIAAAPRQELGRKHETFDPEVMKAMVDAAGILEAKESYLGDKKAKGIIEYATGKVLGIVGGAAGEAFGVGARATINVWYSHQEQQIKQHPLAHRVEVHGSGRPESARTIMCVPGMFDSHVQDRMKSIITRSDLTRDEYWMAIETLYSARDIPRVRAIIDDLEKRLAERLGKGGIVTVVGYSCGGLIGKVLADKLSKRFPGKKIGLVVHNAPLDAQNGFFVRYGGIEELQREIGFTAEHSKNEYPFIILNGDRDMIVPCQDCLDQPGGESIKTKPIPGGHQQRTCIDSPKAARRVYAAVRAVERHMLTRGE